MGASTLGRDELVDPRGQALETHSSGSPIDSSIIIDEYERRLRRNTELSPYLDIGI